MLLACAGLASCQVTGTANAERNLDLSAKSTGVAVVSVTVSGYLPGTHWYQIVDLKSPQQPPISVPTNADSFGLDWNPGSLGDKNFTGRLAVIELAPGDYEIRRWVMMVGNSATYASRRPFGYRFSIAAGEIVYLGNVHTDIQRSASASALPYASTVTDRQERDLPLFQQKYPVAKSRNVKIAVSTSGESRDSGAPALNINSLRDLLPQ
jgi:hypothetical protein